MSEPKATITKRRRIAPIWIVPVVAIVLGGWMVVHTIRNQGPAVTVVFSTAEGIEADKTKIRVRNVEVGFVESVGLGKDLETVVVEARLDKAATELLREDTQFWVVRPRIGTSGVSGIGTLLSGGYIQLAPGTGKKGRRQFRGLEDPPVTPGGTPGLKFKLVTDRAGSVGSGDPILYEGFPVGRIETATFDVASKRMHYDAFINAPYDTLVTVTTRFWNASGIRLSATAEGIEFDMGSLQTLLIGGVTFGLPNDMESGDAAAADTTFNLYPDFKSVNAHPYRHSISYVTSFSQSVRGLNSGAPVDYRGIRVGRVERVLLDEMAAEHLSGTGEPIPVLISLEPGRLKLPDSPEGVERLSAGLARAVNFGLRATLASGNFLTGSQYVALDFYTDVENASVGSFAGTPTIPSVAGGLEGIQQKVTLLLDKLNAVPLEQLGQSAADAVGNLNAIMASAKLEQLPKQLSATLDDLRAVLGSIAPNSPLQERLLRTLTELDRTVESMRMLLSTLDDKPNSVIFSRDAPRDPEPQAGSQ